MLCQVDLASDEACFLAYSSDLSVSRPLLSENSSFTSVGAYLPGREGRARLTCRLSPPQASPQKNVTDEEWRMITTPEDPLRFLCSRYVLAWVYIQRVASPKGV